MEKIFGSSWRTTLMGYLRAAIAVIIPIVQDGNFDMNKDWPFLLYAVATAISGRVQKDSDGLTKEESQIVAKQATAGALPPKEDQ